MNGYSRDRYQIRTYALWLVSPPSHTEHGQETDSSNPASPEILLWGNNS
jgi:hypothetical protein